MVAGGSGARGRSFFGAFWAGRMAAKIGVAAALAAAWAAWAQGDGATTVTILHTNDFHSRIEPINRFDSGCPAEDDAAGECFGGSARLATAIAERRAAASPSLLLDGGDQFQGSLFYTYYKGQAAAEMMNRLGYDAMTVGNHEFNDGPEALRGFMDAVDFPVLLANADVSAEPELAGRMVGRTVIEVGGARIGLIGVAPQNTPELSSPGPRVAFEAPAAAVAREVAALEADGVDKIVLLSHSGYRIDLALAAEVAGLDVIVGGHTNTLLANTVQGAAGPYPTMVMGPDGAPTAVVQAYAYGKFLGELRVSWDADGVVTTAEGEPILMDAAVAPNADVAARIAELAEPLDEIRSRVIGEAAEPIDGSRASCRSGACPMGSLVAEAMLAAAADQGARIAIQNGGGVRASVDAGPITLGEVLTVLPFQNTLAIFDLTGAEIVAALENGVSAVEDGAGRFPQVAGLRFAWSPLGTPGEDRVRSVEVAGPDGWTPIDPDGVYGVVSNNFLRRGGDGYSVFAEQGRNAYDFGPALEDVVADYLAETGPARVIDDGRIEAR